MKRIYWIIVAAFLFLPIAAAVTLKHQLTPQLILNQLNVIKSNEQLGDELYFDISEASTGSPTQFLRVPEKPFNWSSKQLSRLQDTILWSKPLNSGESKTLVISLVDSDSSILNPDDMLGSIKLTIKNEKGVIHTSWGTSQQADDKTIVPDEKGMYRFNLRSKRSEYDVYLYLK